MMITLFSRFHQKLGGFLILLKLEQLALSFINTFLLIG